MTIRQPKDRLVFVRVHGRFIQDARRVFFCRLARWLDEFRTCLDVPSSAPPNGPKAKYWEVPIDDQTNNLGKWFFIPRHSETSRSQYFHRWNLRGLKPWRPTTPMAAEGGGALRQGGQRFLPEIHGPDARSIDTCRGSNRRRSFRRRRLMQIGWSLR